MHYLKRLSFAVVLATLFFRTNLYGQTNDGLIAQYFLSLPPEVQSNVVVLVDEYDPERPQPCPPAYTNLLSNTNLLSPAENKLIHEVMLKYKNVTTNSGPAGSVFKKMSIMESRYQTFHQSFPVAFFTYTNSNATEEIASPDGIRYISAKFRTASGDGYDVMAINGELSAIYQYKSGVLDGLFLGLNDPNNPDPTNNKMLSYLRFVKGMATGKFLAWDEDGKLALEIEFKKPFDIIKYWPAKFVDVWTEPKN